MKFKVFAVGVGAILALGALPAQGQVVTIDENGNGTWLPPGGGAALTLPATMAPDPFYGIVTLSYALPVPVAPGNLQLVEPGQAAYSDLLEFANNRVWFFSDNLDGGTDLADVGVPAPPPVGPTFSVTETGLEGNNGFLYTPNPGLPPFTSPDGGFDPSGQIVSYQVISDAVPEPASLALLILGGALLMRRRR